MENVVVTFSNHLHIVETQSTMHHEFQMSRLNTGPTPLVALFDSFGCYREVT